jgi:mannose-6-phosphate isomerase
VTLAPFRLQPVLVERPWGGTRLAGYGKRLPEGLRVGESWELCDLPQEVAPHVDDPSSIVLDGPYAGARLRTLVAEARDELLGPVAPTPDGRFPLLFKLLDAREHLSVQVHPPAGYVASHPEARLKTESWFIVEAAPDARLYLDAVAGTTPAEIRAAMGSAAIVPLLGEQPAVAGAFHHVPAGRIHALGAGALVAEVQTPSDTTFRIYDWSAEYGRDPRPLHAAEALASIDLRPAGAFSLPPADGPGTRDLVRTEHYWLREHRLPDGPSPLAATRGPRVLAAVAGVARLETLTLPAGTTAIVPAAVDTGALTGPGATVLEIGLA